MGHGRARSGGESTIRRVSSPTIIARTAYDRSVIDSTPVSIHADRGAGALEIGWDDGHETDVRHDARCAGSVRARSAAARPGCPAGSTAARRSPPSRPGWSTSRWSAATPSPRPGATATTPATTRSRCCATAARAPTCTARRHAEPPPGRSPPATRSTHDRRHHAVPVRPPRRRERRAWSSGSSSAAAASAAT